MWRSRHAYIFTFLCCINAPSAHAQFNDSVHYRAAYSGTGILNSTDAGQSYVLTQGLRLSMRKERLEGNASANWIYGEQAERLSNNDFSSHADLNFDSHLPQMYYWGLATFEKSFSLKVNNRTQAGGGIAYNLFNRGDSAFLNVSNGILYEYTNLEVNDSLEDLYSTFRNSFRLKLRYRFRNTVTFEGTGYLQHSLSDSRDYIIRSTASLSLKLNAWMAFTTALTYNKVARTNRENMLLTFGLTIERFF